MDAEQDDLRSITYGFFEHLDKLEIDEIIRHFGENPQGVDELSGGWVRGREGLAEYMRQLEENVSSVKSSLSDFHVSIWGEVGVVTFVLDQMYSFEGQSQQIHAPTTMVYRRHPDGWKVELVHTVPLSEGT